MSDQPKQPYKTPWDGNAEKRLDEDRQWTELSRLVNQGIIGENSCSKVANQWVRQKVKEASQ